MLEVIGIYQRLSEGIILIGAKRRADACAADKVESKARLRGGKERSVEMGAWRREEGEGGLKGRSGQKERGEDRKKVPLQALFDL